MKIKNIIFVAKTAVMAFLSQKIMITRSSIAFEDLLVSSIASQVMPPWNWNLRADIDNIIDRKQAEEAQEIAALNLAKYRSLLSICSFAFEYFDLFGKYS